MDADSTRQAPCNKCLRSTHHKILWEERTEGSEVIDEEHGFYINWYDQYQAIRCCGCDDIRLVHIHYFSEDVDDEGNERAHETFYPPTVTRKKPIWMTLTLPFNARAAVALFPLFEEVYTSLASGSFRLAAMGIRALAERVMIDKVQDRGTFSKTIDAFFEAGFVAPVQQDQFKSVLIEAGHAAMHRGFKPTHEDIETLLNILEGVVDAIYYQPLRAGKLGDRLPPDNRRRGGINSPPPSASPS